MKNTGGKRDLQMITTKARAKIIERK